MKAESYVIDQLCNMANSTRTLEGHSFFMSSQKLNTIYLKIKKETLWRAKKSLTWLTRKTNLKNTATVCFVFISDF